MLTDCDSYFLLKSVRELKALVDIKQIFTSHFHPQTNGLVEGFKCTLVQTISFYVATNHRNWVEYIKPALNRLKQHYNQSKRPQADPPALSDSVDIPPTFTPDESVPKVQVVKNYDVYDPEIFQANKILKSRLQQRVTEYLIKIKWVVAYPSSESSWEPTENIIDPRLIQQFKAKNQNISSLQPLRLKGK